jgi:hypothetical protein
MDVLPGVIAPGAQTVGGSANDPRCWLRCEAVRDLELHDEPIRLDSIARGVLDIVWASYRRWL